jgi:LPXTG-site transpeptidase (sortase) family protein
MRFVEGPKKKKRLTIAIALALIVAGAVLAFGPTALLTLWDAHIARLRQAYTGRWMAKHLAHPGTRANVAQAPVITPGPDGYLLEIPRLNLQLVVHMLEPIALTGVPTPTLTRYGLGQIPYTAVLKNVSPGGDGTAAIAGHRTTHGAPFRHLDVLKPGDLILVRKGTEIQQWRVSLNTVIAPTDVEAIRSHPGVRRLVLLACTPPFSAKSRLMIVAGLSGAAPAVAAASTPRPLMPAQRPPVNGDSHRTAQTAVPAAHTAIHSRHASKADVADAKNSVSVLKTARSAAQNNDGTVKRVSGGIQRRDIGASKAHDGAPVHHDAGVSHAANVPHERGGATHTRAGASNRLPHAPSTPAPASNPPAGPSNTPADASSTPADSSNTP